MARPERAAAGRLEDDEVVGPVDREVADVPSVASTGREPSAGESRNPYPPLGEWTDSTGFETDLVEPGIAWLLVIPSEAVASRVEDSAARVTDGEDEFETVGAVYADVGQAAHRDGWHRHPRRWGRSHGDLPDSHPKGVCIVAHGKQFHRRPARFTRPIGKRAGRRAVSAPGERCGADAHGTGLPLSESAPICPDG